MNKYLKTFLLRGMAFAGFGPIVVGIIWMILEKTVADFSLSGMQALLGILSTYIMAFVQAGTTVFNQIEHWPVPKSVLCHFASLFIVYSFFYVANSWIPFEPKVLLVFSAIFTVGFFVIWATVYFSVKTASKKMNSRLN